MHFNLAASGIRMSRAWCKKATQAADKYALLGMGGSKNDFRGKFKVQDCYQDKQTQETKYVVMLDSAL